MKDHFRIFNKFLDFKWYKKIIISIGYKGDLIKKHFKFRYKNIPIIYALENKPLGTGGGLLNASKYLSKKSSFFLVNGDTYFKINVKKLLNFHFDKSSDLTISLFKSNDICRYKMFELNDDSKIINFDSNNGKNVYVNGGVYLIKKSLIDELIYNYKK